jgi:signal transduction histidine kinase
MDGDAVRGLLRFGRRFAAVLRLITLPVTAVVAVAAADGTRMQAVVTGAWAGVAVWSIAYVVLIMRTRAWWPTAVDGLVLSALALATPYTVPDSWLSTGKSWIVPFGSFACVAYQYYERWTFGGAVAVGVVAAMVAGTALGMPSGSIADGLITACWALAITGLARFMWSRVRRGGKQADDSVAEAGLANRQREVASRLRADELFTNRKLHDTSATTLLLVGLGQTRHVGELIRARAERDLGFLEALRSNEVAAQSDLVDLMHDAIEVSALNVTLTIDEGLVLEVPVSHALAGAVAEALTNVERHAGVTAATVSVTHQSGGIRVEVCDAGRGFDPQAVPETRRGVQQSIIGRMEDVGGSAYVDSKPGQGTIVRLEWRHA